MAWFRDAYLPERDKRSEITASPLRATIDQLAGLPEAFVIADENDVLRDESEAYARKLTEAGVRTTSVRFNGIIHDFMMLNPVRGTAATTAALVQAIHILRKARGAIAVSRSDAAASFLIQPGSRGGKGDETTSCAAAADEAGYTAHRRPWEELRAGHNIPRWAVARY
jgi:acetyl esterase/lipase